MPDTTLFLSSISITRPFQNPIPRISGLFLPWQPGRSKKYLVVEVLGISHGIVFAPPYTVEVGNRESPVAAYDRVFFSVRTVGIADYQCSFLLASVGRWVIGFPASYDAE